MSGPETRAHSARRNQFRERLTSGRFVVTAEVVPPVTCDPEALVAKVRPLKGLADAVTQNRTALMDNDPPPDTDYKYYAPRGAIRTHAAEQQRPVLMVVDEAVFRSKFWPTPIRSVTLVAR